MARRRRARAAQTCSLERFLADGPSVRPLLRSHQSLLAATVAVVLSKSTSGQAVQRVGLVPRRDKPVGGWPVHRERGAALSGG